MQTDPFLQELRKQLKEFSTEQQAALLEEIGDHIESAQLDAALAGDPQQQGKWKAELGSPEELGKGFNAVHRPNRWLDFLLIFVPSTLIIPLLLPLTIWLTNTFPANLSRPILALDIRLGILIGLVFCLIGLRRHSTLMLAFWIPDAAMRLLTLLVREYNQGILPGSAPQNWIEYASWIFILAGLCGWLTKLLRRNRRDGLITAFAILPLICTLLNVSYYWLPQAQAIQSGYAHLLIWNWMGIGISKMVETASLAGFCLLRKRAGRWLALVSGVSFYCFERSIYFWPNPVMVGMWSGLGLVLLTIWYFDQRSQTRWLGSPRA